MPRHPQYSAVDLEQYNTFHHGPRERTNGDLLRYRAVVGEPEIDGDARAPWLVTHIRFAIANSGTGQWGSDTSLLALSQD